MRPAKEREREIFDLQVHVLDSDILLRVNPPSPKERGRVPEANLL